MLVSIRREITAYSTSGLSFSNQLPHQPQYFPRFRMPMLLQFRIQQLPINRHFKPTTIRRHKRHCFDHMLIMLEQFLCQAHGPASVMSDRTVKDLYLQHGPSAKFGRLYHCGNSCKNARTDSSTGFDLICLAVPTCRSIPSAITATRCPKRAASFKLCVTKTAVR